MNPAAFASFLHVAGIAAGLGVLLGRSWYLGDSLLFRLTRALGRRFDLSMMWLATGPPPEEPPLDEERMRRVLAFDTTALFVSGIWVGSGVWRLLGSLDKSTGWYLDNDLFLLKMVLVGALMTLEMIPMTVFIQWRYAMALRDERARRRAAGNETPIPQGPLMRLFLRWGEDVALAPLRWVRRAHAAEEVLLLTILLVAANMARGVGYDALAAVMPSGGGASGLACQADRLLATECARCHVGASAQGGLDLAVREALLGPSSQWPELVRVVPGDPDRSLLIEKLAETPAHGAGMPLGKPLSAGKVGLLRAWVADGAPPCEP